MPLADTVTPAIFSPDSDFTEPASKTPFCCGGAVLALAAKIANPKLNPTITATARNRFVLAMIPP
jgi:hypothetical protein